MLDEARDAALNLVRAASMLQCCKHVLFSFYSPKQTMIKEGYENLKVFILMHTNGN